MSFSTTNLLLFIINFLEFTCTTFLLMNSLGEVILMADLVFVLDANEEPNPKRLLILLPQTHTPLEPKNGYT